MDIIILKFFNVSIDFFVVIFLENPYCHVAMRIFIICYEITMTLSDVCYNINNILSRHFLRREQAVLLWKKTILRGKSDTEKRYQAG